MAIKYYFYHSRGLSKLYDGLRTSPYGILYPMVIFGVSTEFIGLCHRSHCFLQKCQIHPSCHSHKPLPPFVLTHPNPITFPANHPLQVNVTWPHSCISLGFGHLMGTYGHTSFLVSHISYLISSTSGHGYPFHMQTHHLPHHLTLVHSIFVYVYVYVFSCTATILSQGHLHPASQTQLVAHVHTHPTSQLSSPALRPII